MQRERRFYKRYPVNFQFQVTINELKFTNTALNISGDGMQMECDGECVEQFSKCPTSPLSCHIRMTLPNSNKQLALQCRLVGSRRLSQFRYLLGLKFIDLSEADRQDIISCIAKKH